MKCFTAVALGATLVFSSIVAPLPADAFALGSSKETVTNGFADLSEKVLPAVVNIATTQKQKEPPANGNGGQQFQFPPGSMFEELFREFFERGMPPGFQPRSYTPGNDEQEISPIPMQGRGTSLGSGFVISPKGLVVTNNHVIDGADEVTVIFNDNRELKAKVLGADKKTDIALLKIETKEDLPFVRLGSSRQARVGDWVLAVGNPFGLGGSVSAGIISARARNINAGPYDDFIQTDAAINRGNSGGPLFNMRGEVIGISTAIYSPTGGSVGIGFAIPSDLAKPVISQLQEFGRTKRGWLGVHIQEVTKDIAAGLSLDKARGALVAESFQDSPASKAGIKTGDVVLSFNGIEIEESRQLPRIVAETPVGQTVPVIVWRDGKKKSYDVKLGELEAAEKDMLVLNGDEESGSDVASSDAILGLQLENIDSKVRQRFDLTDDVKGVLVIDAERGSMAARTGILRGTILKQVNRQNVQNVKEVKQLVESAKKRNDKAVLLLLTQGGRNLFVALPLR